MEDRARYIPERPEPEPAEMVERVARAIDPGAWTATGVRLAMSRGIAGDMISEEMEVRRTSARVSARAAIAATKQWFSDRYGNQHPACFAIAAALAEPGPALK